MKNWKKSLNKNLFSILISAILLCLFACSMTNENNNSKNENIGKDDNSTNPAKSFLTGTYFGFERWQTKAGGYWDTQKWLAGDFNGDGRSDLAVAFNENGAATIGMNLSSGSSFIANPYWARMAGGFWDTQKWMSGDFNGDGKCDLVIVFNDNNQASIDVFTSTGNSFNWGRWITQAGGYSDDQVWLAGDFNGDGKCDLARVFNDSNNVSIDVFLSTGSGFSWGRWITRQVYWSPGSQKWVVGDFNGDGKKDLAVVCYQGDAYIVEESISIGIGGGQTITTHPGWIGGTTTYLYYTSNGVFSSPISRGGIATVKVAGGFSQTKWFAGHFDGGSTNDYLMEIVNDDNAATFYACGDYTAPWGIQQGGFFSPGQQWFIGDFNGDGKSDISCAFNDSGSGLASEDVHPSLPVATSTSAPVNFTATPVPGQPQINLNWQTSANALSYRIYYSATNSKPSSPQMAALAGTTGVTINNLQYQTTYYCWLEAVYGTIISAASTTQTTTSSTLVGYWKFNETSGASVIDYSGCGNNGTINGTSRVNGIDGNALNFTTQSNYVNCGSNASLNVIGNISIECWIKTQADGYIVNKDNPNSPWNGYVFRINNGVLGFWDGHNWSWGAGTVNIKDNNWHHVAIVGQGTIGKFYIDGNLDSTFTFTAIPDNSGFPLWIGYLGSPGWTFNGKIDEISVWKKALSAAEVQSHYYSKGTVARFNMEDTITSILTDSSGFGNNGTVNGTTRAAGINGNALNFGLQTDYVNCGSGTSLNITGNISIECWIKTLSDGYIVYKGNSNSPWNGYVFRINNGVLGFWDGHNWSWGAGTVNIKDNNWHHIAVVGQGSTGKFYIDGNLNNSFTLTSIPIDS